MSDSEMDVDRPRDSSPLAFPSSEPNHPPSDATVINTRVNQLRSTPRGSSPMHFSDSSQPDGSGRNPLFGPPSSAGSVASNRRTYRNDSPLFFPGSEAGSPARPSRRGDIHSSAVLSTPNSARRRLFSRDGGEPSSSASRLGSVLDQSNAGIRLPSSRLAEVVGAEDMEVADDGPTTVVWGTTVTLQSSMAAFRTFLKEFRAVDRQEYDLRSPEGDHEFRYSKQPAEKRMYQAYIEEMTLTGQTNLNLDVVDLLAFAKNDDNRFTISDEKSVFQLYKNLLNYPQEVIPILDQTLKDCVLDWAYENGELIGGTRGEREKRIESLESGIFKVRPFGLTNGVNMRTLNPQDIDKIVSIKGLVIRATPIIPDMKMAFFRCLRCGHTVTVEIDRGRIAEPERCPRDVCETVGSMSLVHNRCEFADRQVVRLQETPDVVPDGQTPHTISLCLYDELVDTVKPGDRVTVAGIFCSVPVRVSPRERSIKTLFKTYIDVLHLKKSDAKRLGTDYSTREDDRQDFVGVGGEDENDARAMEDNMGTQDSTAAAKLKERLYEIAARPDVYEYLARSLAPSIWEMDDVKKGILLQMFGGSNLSIDNGGGGGGPRYRGDINVLLVGDPGVSKSQILQYVHKIAPRGVYTSGKGSSAVGLTAYVTRDPDTKQLVLESGALVLSDGGICCIDEFDKMSDSTRSVLHEVMEQQTVSIAKAGIITTLNARTSILAAANPVGSKYNLAWPITKNIDLPPTLISRFDLLYLVLDRIDESSDRRLARHLVGLYLEDKPEALSQDILKIEDLSAYISWAKTNIQPEITEEASEVLVQSYVEMRSVGQDVRGSERRITATTRQLESMIRLSEAHARMRYSSMVELEDVEEAYRLIREALKESATDPLTGLIDLDLLNTGQGNQQRKLRGDLQREIINLLDEKGKERGLRWSEVVKRLEEQSTIPIESTEFAEVVRVLEQEGTVKVHGERDKRVIRLLPRASGMDV